MSSSADIKVNQIPGQFLWGGGQKVAHVGTQHTLTVPINKNNHTRSRTQTQHFQSHKTKGLQMQLFVWGLLSWE